jgi:GLPGLI family protein
MKLRFSLIITLLALTGAVHAQAAKKGLTSGRIVFEISYPDSKFDEQTLAMFPTESIMLFKEDKSKVEIKMAGGKTVVISDNKAGSGTMLMDMMGKKWAIDIDKKSLEKEKSKTGKPVVEKTEETKMIAGYLCHKAVVTYKTEEGEKKFDIWYTNDLQMKNSFSSQIEGIDGFMLEFYAFENGMSMKMTAKSVEQLPVDDKEFQIPTDYEKKSLDDLKSMGGR